MGFDPLHLPEFERALAQAGVRRSGSGWPEPLPPGSYDWREGCDFSRYSQLLGEFVMERYSKPVPPWVSTEFVGSWMEGE